MVLSSYVCFLKYPRFSTKIPIFLNIESNNRRVAMVYSEFITGKLTNRPLSCSKFTVNHGFTAVIAFIERLFHIHSKISRNKRKQIKCNGINKNSILPPNNVVPQKRLWLH